MKISMQEYEMLREIALHAAADLEEHDHNFQDPTGLLAPLNPRNCRDRRCAPSRHKLHKAVLKYIHRSL